MQISTLPDCLGQAEVQILVRGGRTAPWPSTIYVSHENLLSALHLVGQYIASKLAEREFRTIQPEARRVDS